MNLLDWTHASRPLADSASPLLALCLWGAVMLAAMRQQPLHRWTGQLPVALLAGAVAALLVPWLVAPAALMPQLAVTVGASVVAFGWPLLALRQAAHRA